MPIYEFAKEKIQRLTETTFGKMQMREREDLQRLLRDNIEVIAPDTLVIAEEFEGWDESRLRIDLLGIDRVANLVVIELKRTKDGGHMELQAIRYAAMVSTMTFDQAVHQFDLFLSKNNQKELDARTELLKFLKWKEPDEDKFAKDVRIVLASADFNNPELTTSVLWLVEREIDIRCVRLQPYELEGRALVDVQQIIPLPEAAEYQVKVREKAQKERKARSGGRDYTRYDLTLAGQSFPYLPKGRAIYRIFRHLVESGVELDEIEQHFGGLFVFVEGEVGPDDFLPRAQKKIQAEGRNRKDFRYFCSEDELVRFNGRTYAFSTEHGNPDWTEAMKRLQKELPDQAIEFSPSDPNRDRSRVSDALE